MVKQAKMPKNGSMVLEFIQAYIKIHQVSPSYEAIAQGLGMKSKSNAYRIVKRLTEHGMLETLPRKFYGIRIK